MDDRENAVMADGYCPPCMAAEIERLRTLLLERDLFLVKIDKWGEFVDSLSQQKTLETKP